MGIGQFTLAIVVLGMLAWLTFLITHSRVRRRREPAPQNLSPFLTDDELESKRLSKVLVSALIATAVLAIVMPVYYLNEADRQVAAQGTFDEIAEERGLEWFEEFKCGNCHGADGGGGGATFIEARSGIETTWAAPSLNDITYRYTEDEIRFWIVFGRPDTPMPSWGVEGGGPLDSQQVDELIAYIEHIQIPQAEAVAEVEGKVSRALTRLEGADATVATSRDAIEAKVAAINAAPAQYEAITPLGEDVRSLLTDAATCTDATAAALKLPCNGAAADTDRDGVSDAAEVTLNSLLGLIVDAAPESSAATLLGKVQFDPANPFTTAEGPTPIPDLDEVDVVVSELQSIERDLRITVQTSQALLDNAQAGLDFLVEAADARRWTIDIEQTAAAEFGGNVTEARRAAALYNAYCARCHTAGYSAGVAFTQEAGSGAIGPSLRDGRSAVQFPNEQDHLDFIIKGSAAAQPYGLNGIGRGWMPGFGTVLSEHDLMLIVRFERSL